MACSKHIYRCIINSLLILNLTWLTENTKHSLELSTCWLSSTYKSNLSTAHTNQTAHTLLYNWKPVRKETPVISHEQRKCFLMNVIRTTKCMNFKSRPLQKIHFNRYAHMHAPRNLSFNFSLEMLHKELPITCTTKNYSLKIFLIRSMKSTCPHKLHQHSWIFINIFCSK